MYMLPCSWNPFENNPPVSMVRLEKNMQETIGFTPNYFGGSYGVSISDTLRARPGPAGPASAMAVSWRSATTPKP